MEAWALAHPFLTFMLVPVLAFFVWRVIANIAKGIVIIIRGYQPTVCEECQMALFEDGHNTDAKH